jgi:hypothetical protein
MSRVHGMNLLGILHHEPDADVAVQLRQLAAAGGAGGARGRSAGAARWARRGPWPVRRWWPSRAGLVDPRQKTSKTRRLLRSAARLSGPYMSLRWREGYRRGILGHKKVQTSAGGP